jgi:hypothetical protein
MTWIFDMGAAPKGKNNLVARKIGKNTVEVEEHVPTLIIAASGCGVVNISRWMPKAGRWCMYSKDTPPIAWQPFPTHPEEE